MDEHYIKQFKKMMDFDLTEKNTNIPKSLGNIGKNSVKKDHYSYQVKKIEPEKLNGLSNWVCYLFEN